MQETGLQDGRLVLDWLSFTLDAEDGLASVEALFGEKKERPCGTRGYSHSAEIVNKGTVSWSPDRPQQGVHVELSSSALASLVETNPTFHDVKGFLVYLIGIGASITRLDFALDDREERLSMEMIRESINADRFTSRWRKIDRVYRMRGGSGETIYFGSRQSESFLRIYDKQAEQIDNGEDDPGKWIRVELELKGERSHIAAIRYIKEGVPAIIGLIRNQLDFKNVSSDINNSRWATSKWWGEFLDWAEKTKLSIPREIPTAEKMRNWLSSQAATSLACIKAIDGGSDDFYHKLIESGEHRYRPIHKALIQAHERAV